MKLDIYVNIELNLTQMVVNLVLIIVKMFLLFMSNLISVKFKQTQIDTKFLETSFSLFAN